LEITFARKLRDEQKFPSLSALREQIARDVALVRHLPDGEKGSLFP
jgi:FAD synthase